MHRVMESYLDPVFHYALMSGPDKVQTRADAIKHGNNCIALAHLVLGEMSGQQLPQRLMGAELYLDRGHFQTADSAELQEGDLIWFGLRNPRIRPEEFKPVYELGSGRLVNWRDFPVKHVAVYTGEHVGDDPLLLHASFQDGTNSVWPLSRFGLYQRYAQVYGATRLQEQLVPAATAA